MMITMFFRVLAFHAVLLFNSVLGGTSAASAGVWSANVIPPQILTSVDEYNTVCPGEKIFLTCHASNSQSLSWTSFNHVGQRAAIEFCQGVDRPGVGKLVSLPNGRATLAQMIKSEQSISSNLKITIPSDLNKTWVTCTNNRGAAVSKTFMLSKEPPTRLTFLGHGKVIAENSNSGVIVYRFTWLLPANNECVDIKHMKFRVDQQPPIILMSNITEVILPLSFESIL